MCTGHICKPLKLVARLPEAPALKYQSAALEGELTQRFSQLCPQNDFILCCIITVRIVCHENSNFSSTLQPPASFCILFPPPPPPSFRTLLLLPPSPPSCDPLETKGSHQPIDHANLPCDPLPNDGPQKNQVCSVLFFVCSLPVLLRAALWYSQQVAHLASAAVAAQRVETYILL